ncbi:sigma-70 family RNA polymerase sigma factor [Dactylosporangium vinaceum]|uniref:Sigma-70 family RNA polymerase sigma factor n=1 Tax=Dactylosporangium vinaceum TaxID=53362 RepID=A0ABV5M4D4_9ACTN|nr:sigma-70 family RNA polymerase sigma factor [Dactylosporangium vinaceum]UAB96202.1 sigma-70 family RNA polymerase sigma factor [Dactylosporangium vinaceum]
MSDEALAREFEAQRPRLKAVAHRMLGSAGEADDAVQEAWLRLTRQQDSKDNLAAWLTTVVGRICLDMLRARAGRREDPLPITAEPVAAADPEQEALLADSVGLALLVVLETLTPSERLAFVLHDLFAVSFDDIAVVVGRSPAAARQLASRARRRVQMREPVAGGERPEAVVEAFLAASRGGDLGALLKLLDPDVVMRADETAARMGGSGETRGAEVVAAFFNGRARGARPGGGPVALVFAGRRVKLALVFAITGGRITAIDAIADPADLAELRSS